ncbi:hypothetical protein [Burkholderia gladioli]|uniref:hypothetical protein n=1 Tax=Burkholderia gladioli TaxID=28095 RepID=UPI0016405E6A|nr:hypothetical protein [Burkholderia gladioli]
MMGTTKKPRRKYDPNRCILRISNNVERRMDANPLTEDRQRDLGLQYHIAFENMLRAGNEESWYILAGSMNVALVLAEKGYGEEYIPEIKTAMLGLMSIKYRADAGGPWKFGEAGEKAMRRAIELHDQQCQIATRKEIKQALQVIVERARQGHMYAAEDCLLEVA